MFLTVLNLKTLKVKLIYMDKLDISLMYVTDDRILDKEKFFEVLNGALAGGATIIQLREKSMDSKSFIERAIKVKEMCKNYNVPLLINDRLDVALAVNADGLHIGQKDIPYKRYVFMELGLIVKPNHGKAANVAFLFIQHVSIL